MRFRSTISRRNALAAKAKRIFRGALRAHAREGEGDYRECHRHTIIAPDLERDGFRVIHIAGPRYTAPRRPCGPELPGLE